MKIGINSNGNKISTGFGVNGKETKSFVAKFISRIMNSVTRYLSTNKPTSDKEAPIDLNQIHNSIINKQDYGKPEVIRHNKINKYANQLKQSIEKSMSNYTPEEKYTSFEHNKNPTPAPVKLSSQLWLPPTLPTEEVSQKSAEVAHDRYQSAPFFQSITNEE